MENIHMIWIGDIQESVQKCIDSFARFHNVYLWTYPQEITYTNCTIKDLSEISKLEDVHKNLKLTSFKVDWFRLNIIYKYGGWYSDCDNYCIAPLDFKESAIFTYFTNDKGDLNNSIFKCSKESNIIKHLIDIYSFDEHLAPYLEFSDNCKNKEALYLHSDILHFKIKDVYRLDKNITKVVHLFGARDENRNLNFINTLNFKLNE